MDSVSKSEMGTILEKTEIRNKLLNSFNRYLQFEEDLKNKGLQFEKTVTKFSKTSAAIYLPKRLIGKKFTVYLMPINDGYEISEPTEVEKIEGSKAADKLIKDTEKELAKIQSENAPRKNLLDINPETYKGMADHQSPSPVMNNA